MSGRRWAMLAAIALITIQPAIGVGATAPGSPPQASAILQAQVALGFNPLTRCPDLRPAGAEDQGVAVVVFLVGPSGVPSRPSVASPSQSEGLDAAAMGCVLRLRFQAATLAGDGKAVESWQQMAWKWTRPAEQHGGALATTTAMPAPPGGANAVALPATQANDASGQRRAPASEGRAEVNVCVDEAGRVTQEPTITRSSGDPRFDAAAVNVARAASGQYRPPTADARPVAGCLQLAIKAGQ
jgi:TonB family protein